MCFISHIGNPPPPVLVLSTAPGGGQYPCTMELYVKSMILFFYKPSQNSEFIIFAIRFRVQFFPKKKFLSLYSNMAAPNMNGRLHLADVHQNSPASL